MSFYYVREGRIIELRQQSADPDYWENYFLTNSESINDLRAVVKRKLAEAERGIMPEPYGSILSSWDLKGKKILDLGCGMGFFVLALQRLGFDAEGVEYSDRIVQTIREHYPGLAVSCEDARHTRFADDSFDVILSLGVVEHSEEGPEKYLTEIYRLLKNDGMLVISVPSFNLIWKLRMLLSDTYNPKNVDRIGCSFHQYRFSEKEIHGILAESGFRLIRCGSEGAIKSLEDAFPWTTKLWRIRGGHWLRTNVFKRFAELIPNAGHMQWIIASKR